jgi:hypothetical protein
MIRPHQKQIDFNDFDLVRYGGGSREYIQTCARLHASTNGHCTQCGVKTSRQGEGSHWTVGQLHHEKYFSNWLWFQDLWRAVTGQQSEAPLGTWGAVVPGREVIGKNAWPACRRCHDQIHNPSNRLWINEPALTGVWADTFARYGWSRGWVLPVYRNRNAWKLTQMLRAKWSKLSRQSRKL